MKFKAYCYMTFGVLVLSIFLYGGHLDLPKVVFLTVLALIASASPLDIQGKLEIRLLLPILIPAMIFLSPGSVGIVAAIGSFEWEHRKWPLPFILINRACVGLPTLLGSMAAHYFLKWDSVVAYALSFVACYLVYESTNAILACFGQYLRNGKLTDDWLSTIACCIKNSSLSFTIGLVTSWLYSYQPWLFAATIGLFVVNKDKFRALLINEQLYPQIIKAMMKVIENADSYTKGHSERVAYFAVRIGKEMHLKPWELERLRLIATLHDLGKQSVPGEIIRKKGRLSPEEYNVVKTHCAAGENILKDISLFTEDQLRAIREHHEWFNGCGYPNGLKGEEICLWARIIAVADVFDAMTSHRPYRETWKLGQAVAELSRCSGTQFDPEVVKAFLRALEGEDPNSYVAIPSFIQTQAS